LKNNDLFDVLVNDSEAQEYMNKLPNRIRLQVCMHSDALGSFSDIKSYVDQLTHYSK
jgi:hypothetical protein